MQRAATAALIALGIVIVPGLVVESPPAVAQDATPTPGPPSLMPPPAGPASVEKPSAFDPALPTPPDVAGGIFQNSLANADVFAAGRCVTGWARGDVVGEGFRITVSGPCVEGGEAAALAVPGRGIGIADGDLALDLKTAAGTDRVTISVYVRTQPGKLLGASINAAAGEAKLFRTADGNTTVISSRTDVGELAIPTDWNRLAIRLKGSEMWLLLNDDPILHATDVPQDAGGVGIGIRREGSVEDDHEIAVVFRDLNVSTVADADPARAPSYTRP